MIRTGIVKEKREDSLRVCFERPESCAGCKACQKGRARKELVTVYGEAEVGDIVDVQMPDSQVFKASLLLYLLPLCGLLIGLAVGYLVKATDGFTVLFGLIGLGACYAMLRVVESRLKQKKQWRPVVVSVFSQAFTHTEREDKDHE